MTPCELPSRCPGLLTPLRLRDRWLVDGSLVNPLPVSLCRALGADIIIGVSMNGDLISRPQRGLRAEVSAPLPENERSSWLRLLTMRFNAQSRQRSAESFKVALPDANNRISYAEVIGQSLLVTQDFISRVRLAADPVDVLIAPDVAHISMIDFHRGAEAIEAGRRATLAVKEKITQAANLAKNAAVRGERAG